ncbi:MAG: hypothetical protein Q7K54_00340 [Candidatus Parcubacteria bacterium]|nr:hypothetical protein [Candidatus Parcubacteria bacterium]
MFSLQFLVGTIVSFGWFISAVLVAFYIPGRVVLGKYLNKSPNIFFPIVISLVVGIVLWAYQGAILGYLGVRLLSYLYLGIFFFIWIKQQRINKRLFGIKNNLFFSKLNLLLTLVFLFGIFGQVQHFLLQE